MRAPDGVGHPESLEEPQAKAIDSVEATDKLDDSYTEATAKHNQRGVVWASAHHHTEKKRIRAPRASTAAVMVSVTKDDAGAGAIAARAVDRLARIYLKMLEVGSMKKSSFSASWSSSPRRIAARAPISTGDEAASHLPKSKAAYLGIDSDVLSVSRAPQSGTLDGGSSRREASPTIHASSIGSMKKSSFSASWSSSPGACSGSCIRHFSKELGRLRDHRGEEESGVKLMCDCVMCTSDLDHDGGELDELDGFIHLLSTFHLKPDYALLVNAYQVNVKGPFVKPPARTQICDGRNVSIAPSTRVCVSSLPLISPSLILIASSLPHSTYFPRSSFSRTMSSPTLPPAQRIRLMRSTRKLGALLGETPRVQVSAAAPPPSAFSSARQQLLRRRSSARSLSLSLSSTPPQAELADTQPTLLVLFPSITGPRSRRSSSSSSTSSTPTQTPLSPSWRGRECGHETPPPREAHFELTRSLGENVPPELVISSASTDPTSREGSGKARRRASTLGLGVSSTAPRSRASTLSTPPSSILSIAGDDDEEQWHLLRTRARLSPTPPQWLPTARRRVGRESGRM
ncbi:hypothetical protein R3P38DRAFT_3515373 [Favolaschia claudopus]|uniref:Uncharacterized protein n=1 Tax=Favolaschia claudopus TaxID=2862362 RepID=A0AAV9YZT0_9AGAR